MTASSFSWLAGVVAVLGLTWLLATWLAARRADRIVDIVEKHAQGDDVAPTTERERRALAALHAVERDLRGRLEASIASRALAERALDRLDEGVLVLESDQSIVYANPRAASLLGRAIEGGRLRDAMLVDLARVAPDSRRVTEFQDPVSKRWLAATASSHGASGTIVLVVRDETDRRRMAAIRRNFVADASHELKTPVAAMQASIETLLTALGDGDGPAALRFARSAHAAADRLAALAADLLDLSRLEAGGRTDQRFDLSSIISNEVERFREEVPRPTFEGLHDDVFVRGSPDDLGLAVRNLLANAVAHTSAADEVKIRLTVDGSWATIEVADTGVGISSKDLPRVFERFYRADPARARETGGTGLGLSIVRHVVDLHGGTVSATSVLGEGAVFRVRLPLDSAASDHQYSSK